MHRGRAWRTAKRIALIGGALALAAGAVLFLLRPTPVSVAEVLVRDIAPAVQGVGTVEAKVSTRSRTAAENVALMLTLNGIPLGEAMQRTRALLQRLDLGHRADTHPATLSGGELQRLAVARALVNDPSVILADEPTAALDTERGKAVMDLLRRLGRERQAAVIAVTHDEQMIAGFDRVYHMTDGRITNGR
jgi:predicted ABC-type transport system involved in lysophospholipase L1 biosynthesis ATPase subunit